MSQQSTAGGRICPAFGKDCLTKSQAKSLAKRLAKRQSHSMRPGQMNAFLCWSCKCWHVGTNVKGITKLR